MKKISKVIIASVLLITSGVTVPIKATSEDYKFRVEVQSNNTMVYGNVDSKYNAEFVFPKTAVINSTSATINIKMKDVAGLGVEGEKVFSKTINTGLPGTNIELNTFNIDYYAGSAGMKWWNWGTETLTSPLKNFQPASVSGTIGGKEYSYALAANHDDTNWKIKGTPSSNVPAAWRELVKHITATSKETDDSKIKLKAGTYFQIGTQKLVVTKDFDIDNLPNLSEEAIRDVLTLDTSATSTGHQMQISIPKGTELKLSSSSAVLKDDAVVTVDGMVETAYFNVLLSNLRSTTNLTPIRVFGSALDIFFHGVKGISGQDVKVDISFPNVPVDVDVTSITLNKTNVSLKEGQSIALIAKIHPTNATINKELTWNSSNDTIVGVDTKGNVIAKKAGNANVTVTTTNGKTATAKVVVTKTQSEATPPTIPTPPTIDPTKPVDKVSVGVNDTTAKETLKKVTDTIINGDFDKYTTKEVADKVKAAIDRGETISTDVKIKAMDPKDVSKVDVNLVKEGMHQIMSQNNSTCEIAQYLDLNILLTANTASLGNIDSLDKQITFTAVLPKNLIKAGRTFHVIRIHDGAFSILETKLEGNSITFATDKFSTYAIIYEDKTETTPPITPPSEPTKPGDTTTDKAPVTGDSSNTTLFAGFALLGLVTMGIVIGKKKRKSLNK